MRNARGLASALLLAVAPSGCVEWEEQEVRIARDAELDRLDAQIVHRGLSSGSTRRWTWIGTAPVVEDAKGTDELLEQLLQGRPVFALLDGILLADVAAWRESDDPLLAALGARIAVNHGAFFRAEDGRLCAWQHVRIANVTSVLQMCDTLMHRFAASPRDAADARRSLGIDDAESVRRFDEFVGKGERWFDAREDAVVMRIPASDRAARALAERIDTARPFDALLSEWHAFDGKERDTKDEEATEPESGNADVQRRATGRPSEVETSAAFLHMLGVSGRPIEGGVELRLPTRGATIRLPALETPPAAERFDLTPHLEKWKVAVRTDVTDATLRAEFASFRRY